MRDFNRGGSRDGGFRRSGDRSRGGFGDRGGRGGFGGGSRSGSDRVMYDAICSECGDKCKLPFRPTGDKPVYCSNCFEQFSGSNNERGSRDRNSSSGSSKVSENYGPKIEMLNNKLDKILELLSGKSIENNMEEIKEDNEIDTENPVAKALKGRKNKEVKEEKVKEKKENKKKSTKKAKK